MKTRYELEEEIRRLKEELEVTKNYRGCPHIITELKANGEIYTWDKDGNREVKDIFYYYECKDCGEIIEQKDNSLLKKLRK